MSDQSPRQSGPYADDPVPAHASAEHEAIPFDAPYRTQRPSDDFSDANLRLGYNPYAAEPNGFGRSYDTPYDQDDKRGLIDRAADEVASWFGGRDTSARREGEG